MLFGEDMAEDLINMSLRKLFVLFGPSIPRPSLFFGVDQVLVRS